MYHFPSDVTYVKEASKKILAEIQNLPFSKDDRDTLRLCFEEAYINAVKHGNKEDPALSVDVGVLKDRDYLEIKVKDQGEGFDYHNCPDPTKDENLSKKGGRGLFLIRKFMDDVVFEEGGRVIRMRKKIPA